MSQPAADPGDRMRRRLSTGPVLEIGHGRWWAEVRGDEIADIRFDGVALLRAIRPVVRDHDWNTVPVRPAGPPRQSSAADPARTVLTVELIFQTAGIHYRADLVIVVTDRDLTVDFAGRAESEFLRNRIGLVVLHRADEAGRPVEVVHSDGSVAPEHWPTTISPHQPFRDVRGFRWQTGGVRAELGLAGDVFETEDQRNWTDHSFKTYGTPLSLPIPVLVRTGDTVQQQVRLTAGGRRTSAPPAGNDLVVVTDQVAGRVPELGLGAQVYPGFDPQPPALPPRPPVSGLGSVLLELRDPEHDWPRQIAMAGAQAEELGAGLDVRLVPSTTDALTLALDLLPTDRLRRVGVFDPHSHTTTRPLWRRLLRALLERQLEVATVAGTRAHFTELNRQFERLPPEAPELTFSVTPQMHAGELPHLVDSLAGQRLVAENSVRLAAGRPVHVGPVTLARRFNAVSTGPPSDPRVDAERAVDELQTTEFAAAWTLGSLAALSAPGIASVTYFEIGGPRGIRAADGSPYPLAKIIAWAAARAGAPVLRAAVPAGVVAYPLVPDGDRVEVALANLRSTAVGLSLEQGGHQDHVRLAPWSVRLPV